MLSMKALGKTASCGLRGASSTTRATSNGRMTATLGSGLPERRRWQSLGANATACTWQKEGSPTSYGGHATMGKNGPHPIRPLGIREQPRPRALRDPRKNCIVHTRVPPMASSGMSFTTAQAGLMATKLRMRPMAHRPLRPTMECCMRSMRDTRPQVWARAPPSARPSSTRSTVRAASSFGIQLLSLRPLRGHSLGRCSTPGLKRC